jgi:UDP-N-acetylglucosamine 2-epimerase (non-hydrolysing)
VTPLSVLAVAGCRPNFVKLGPLLAALSRRDGIAPLLVHTGQHYDRELSEVFFRDLGLPAPDVALQVGSGSHAAQTARVMAAIEGVLLERAPDLVLVVGDVNSTVAAALTAVKLGIPVAHVEAGLRSFDREMPEEVNRVVTDAVSDLLFATEASAVGNLRREGVPPAKVRLVGTVMADALLASRERIARSDVRERLGLARRGYAVLTLHRPENVDHEAGAAGIVEALEKVQRLLPVVFPVHPRTRERFAAQGVWRRLERARGLAPIAPLGYLDFLKLTGDAAFVLTDSGGVQEETTVLGVPCLTLRPSTERPATVTAGSNRVVGREPAAIVAAARRALDGAWPSGRVPPLWDGRASERIAAILLEQAGRIRALYRGLRRRTACARTAA